MEYKAPPGHPPRSYVDTIKIDPKLPLKDRLLSEIAQLKMILQERHPADVFDRARAVRRLCDIKRDMLSRLFEMDHSA